MADELPLEEQLQMFYPTMELNPERGMIPNVHLPLDYLARVKRFYEQGRREVVEVCCEETKRVLEGSFMQGFPWEIMLRWDEERGLTNVGIHGAGLDLTDDGWPHFQEHNLGGLKSVAALIVAQRYVSELMKS